MQTMADRLARAIARGERCPESSLRRPAHFPYYNARMTARLILASGSPRRRELLTALGIPFIVVVSNEPEPLLEGISPREQTVQLALRKARAVASAQSGGWVLGADTIVVLDGEILGKPEDPADAVAMLQRLRGRDHEVYTGLALVNAATSEEHTSSVPATVSMRDASDDEIATYVATGEPLDKAGAYGIQGLGGALVAGYDGCFNTIVGLPLCGVAALLRDAGVALPIGEPACRRPDGSACPEWPAQ
jgi:septum formation protein